MKSLVYGFPRVSSLAGLTVCVFCMTPGEPAFAAPPDRLWIEVGAERVSTQASTAPALRRFRLDFVALDAVLARVGPGAAARARAREVWLTVPTPDGAFLTFRVNESPVMAPELAAKFPEIRTYRGQGVEGTAAMRFARTPLGFHAIVLAPEGAFFVQPERRGERSMYISYRADGPLAEGFECTLKSLATSPLLA